MKLTEDLKSFIDTMSYNAMASLYAHAPIGEPIFKTDSGPYFLEVMEKKRALMTEEDVAAIHKLIGFEDIW